MDFYLSYLMNQLIDQIFVATRICNYFQEFGIFMSFFTLRINTFKNMWH